MISKSKSLTHMRDFRLHSDLFRVLFSILATSGYSFFVLTLVQNFTLTNWFTTGLALLPILVGIYLSDTYLQAFALKYRELCYGEPKKEW
ncbi:hypothetical protein VCHA53O466_40428 [Vibrio chagasii]|nr:hypothetical protein VCHA53O466_40428 [Vibrio chagasii]